MCVGQATVGEASNRHGLDPSFIVRKVNRLGCVGQAAVGKASNRHGLDQEFLTCGE